VAGSRFYQKYTWAVSCERTFVNLIAVFAEENETSGCWLGLQVIFSKNASILHQCHEAFLRSILRSTFNFLIHYRSRNFGWLYQTMNGRCYWNIKIREFLWKLSKTDTNWIAFCIANYRRRTFVVPQRTWISYHLELAHSLQ
jgi:hypothetical protein